MKVLLLSGSYPPIECGVGDYTAKLCKFLAGTPNPPAIRLLTSSDVPKDQFTLPVIKNWGVFSLPKLIRWIKREAPDLVHIQYHSVRYGRNLMINFLPLFLKLRAIKAPVCLTIHEYHDASWLGKLRVLLTCSPVDQVIVTNEVDMKLLGKTHLRPKLATIEIGSNIEPVKMSLKERALTKKEFLGSFKNLVVYFGFIDPSKGVDELVESLGLWPKDARLVVATSYQPNNPYHKKLKRGMEKYGSKIFWTGFLPENKISKLLQAADVVVLPFSHPTTLRRGSLKASLAHAAPTIITGPVEPPLENEVNCIAIDPASSRNIAQTVTELLLRPEERKHLSKGAKSLAATYEWPKIAKSHLRLYDRLLDGRRVKQ